MGLYLIETGDMLMRIRRRHRYRGSRHPLTLWGFIFLVVGAALMLAVKIWDSKDKESGKTVKVVIMVVAVIFIILSTAADAMGDKS